MTQPPRPPSPGVPPHDGPVRPELVAGQTPGIDPGYRPYLPTAPRQPAQYPAAGPLNAPSRQHDSLSPTAPQRTHDAGTLRPSIEQFRNRRGPAPLVVALVAATVVIGLLWVGNATRTPTPVPTPSSVTATSTQPQPSSPVTSVPPDTSIIVVSERDNAAATWEILAVTWDDSGVTVQIRITVTRGTLYYQFSALDSTTAAKYDAEPPSGDGELSSGVLNEGMTATGHLRFTKPRGDTMIYMRDSIGEQITALTIKG